MHVVEGGVDVAGVARCIELSAVKYCPISAMLSAGPTAIHHRYRIIDTRTEPPTMSEGTVMVTGPNQPATIEALRVGLTRDRTRCIVMQGNV